MKNQNFNKHKRTVPIYLAAFLILSPTTVVLATIHLFYEQNLVSILLFLLSVSLLTALFYIRTFPLKAQDRAIRAEENLRYFSLTGKLFDKKLHLKQIIALRFSDDIEFVALVEKALKENLSNQEIKKEIKIWKADHHRV